jgi:hypothetical protein
MDNAMAIPVPQAVGSVVIGVGALTVSWPAHVADDVGLLFVESANQAVSAPAGWAEVTNQGTGTAGADAATRLTVFWKRAASAAEANVAVADSGARQQAVIHTFRGCILTGNPYDVVAGNVQAAANAAMSIPGATSTVADALIVAAMSNSLGVAAPTVQLNTLVNVSLTNVTKRLNTQEDGVGGSSTDGFLPVGWMAFGSGGTSGEVGEGPDLVAADPRCTCCMFVPNITTIGAKIDTADQHNILLVLNVAGNKGSYTTTVGGVPTLDMAKFESNVRRFRPDADNTAFVDRLKFADAVRRRRIILYVVDEPNLTTALVPNVPNITPIQTNQMALLHKASWNGYQPLTLVRVPAETMASGWNGASRPAGGWTGVDFCWSQYTSRHGKGNSVLAPWGNAPVDPRDLLAEQRAIVSRNNLNMGVAVSLNMYAGGHAVDSLGVTAAWDTDNNGSGPNAYVIGTAGNPAGQGDAISAPLPDSLRSLLANPNWIRKFAELTATDPDVPFLLYWQHTEANSPSNEYINYYQRADFRAAFDDAINFGLARSTATPWRTAK